jgi:hypothetical protein
VSHTSGAGIVEPRERPPPPRLWRGLAEALRPKAEVCVGGAGAKRPRSHAAASDESIRVLSDPANAGARAGSPEGDTTPITLHCARQVRLKAATTARVRTGVPARHDIVAHAARINARAESTRDQRHQDEIPAERSRRSCGDVRRGGSKTQSRSAHPPGAHARPNRSHSPRAARFLVLRRGEQVPEQGTPCQP